MTADPAIINDTARSILDVGVIGAVCLLLIATLVVRERHWLKREDRQTVEFKAAMKEERDAHELTRSAHLSALVASQSLLNVVNQHMQSQSNAVDAVLRALGKDEA
jgi:hypothetical protein